MTYLKHKTLPPGLEPGISRLGGGCPIHWATGACKKRYRFLHMMRLSNYDLIPLKSANWEDRTPDLLLTKQVLCH